MASKEEMLALWEEVKANSKRLVDCSGPHDFVGIEAELQGETKDGGKLYRRYVCTKCGGKILSHDKLWYERGLQHGRELHK